MTTRRCYFCIHSKSTNSINQLYVFLYYKQVSESYRKLRNTLRYLVGSLSDFDPEKDKVHMFAVYMCIIYFMCISIYICQLNVFIFVYVYIFMCGCIYMNIYKLLEGSLSDFGPPKTRYVTNLYSISTPSYLTV